MANRIYTQADYDKITDMYNTYQAKKDSYTADQQKGIDKKFSDAFATVSNRIEESKNKIADMYTDANDNVVQVYGDGRQEIVKSAPTQQPKAVVSNPKPKIKQESPVVAPENVNILPPIDRSKEFDPYTSKPADIVNTLKSRGVSNEDIKLVLDKWGQKLQKDMDALETAPVKETTINATELQIPQLKGTSTKQDYYSKYMQMKGTGAPSVTVADWFRSGFGMPNSTSTSLVRNDLKKKGLTDQQINDFIIDRGNAVINYKNQGNLVSSKRIQTKGNDGTYTVKGGNGKGTLSNLMYL